MRTAASPSTTTEGSVDMFTMRRHLASSLRASKEYRHAFIEESIRARLTAQIRSIREDQYHWDYKEFAEKLGKKPSWVYRLEDPNAPTPTVATLLRVADALDVALDVRFVPFSKVVDDVTTLGPHSFSVVPCEDDPGLLERKEPQSALSPDMAQALRLSAAASTQSGYFADVGSFAHLPKSTQREGLLDTDLSRSLGAAVQAKGIHAVSKPLRRLPLDLTPNLDSSAQVADRRMHA